MLSENTASRLRPPTAVQQKIAFAALCGFLLLYLAHSLLFLLVVGSLILVPFFLYLSFRVLDGDGVPVMFLWVVLFPFGYYFLTFPRSGTIFTLDRMVVVLLALATLLCPTAKATAIPKPLVRSAWAWVVFLAISLLSLVLVRQITTPFRMLLEAFLFPGILAWYVIACFPVRRYIRVLHCIICLVTVCTAAIGAAEMVLGRDLLALSEAEGVFAGMGTELILRPNGPYIASHSFGLIGLATFCLLVFFREIAGAALPGWQRVVHGVGITAALLQAMMPLSRSIYITIGAILFLDLFRDISRPRKAVRIAVLSSIALGALMLMIYVPEIFTERVSDPGNVYARLAQQKQNTQLFLAHPILGVGFGNFHEAAITSAVASVSYEGVPALDYPHSNLGSVLAETGLLGFVPYIASQLLLVLAFWKIRSAGNRSSRRAWIFFVYVFLSYWITGISIASAYSADLNLWYMFCFALIYKYAITRGAAEETERFRGASSEHSRIA